MHNHFSTKKIATASFITIFALQFCLVNSVSAMVSQENDVTYKSLTTQSPEAIYKSRYYLQTENFAVETPEVGELILPKGVTGGDVYLVDATTGKPEGFVFRSTSQKAALPFTVKVGGKNESALSDENNASAVTLPIKPSDIMPQYSDIEVTFQKPTSISGVRLNLDALSQAPQTVTIKGLNRTQGSDQVVFINQLAYQPILKFPTQEVTQLLVTLSYSQTLRLTEVGFLQSDTSNNIEQEKIRFLIKPKSNYVLYFNRDPQQPSATHSTESGDLFSKKDFVPVKVPPMEPNPLYKPADKDSDGVLDAQDNCVAIVNTDQLDKNRNGVGDACEDFDADSVLNARDNCPEEANFAQQDRDGDDIGDACDEAESRLTEQNPWLPWAAMAVTGLLIAGLFISVIRSKKFSPVTPISRSRQNE